jgi:hypothetical membrane protein
VTDRQRDGGPASTPGSRPARLLLSGAIWGPCIFIAAWIVGGLLLSGYSPVDQHISDLAAVDASTTWLMTLGFAAFAIGVGVAAWPLRRLIGWPAALTLGINGALMVGIALTPTGGSPDTDRVHAVLALLLYASLAAIAPLAAMALRRHGAVVALGSLAVGVVTLAFLSASLGETRSGLLQRIGMTITDAWLIAIGIAAITGPNRR